jgi:hypothetical protein
LSSLHALVPDESLTCFDASVLLALIDLCDVLFRTGSSRLRGRSGVRRAHGGYDNHRNQPSDSLHALGLYSSWC